MCDGRMKGDIWAGIVFGVALKIVVVLVVVVVVLVVVVGYQDHMPTHIMTRDCGKQVDDN